MPIGGRVNSRLAPAETLIEAAGATFAGERGQQRTVGTRTPRVVGERLDELLADTGAARAGYDGNVRQDSRVRRDNRPLCRFVHPMPTPRSQVTGESRADETHRDSRVTDEAGCGEQRQGGAAMSERPAPVSARPCRANEKADCLPANVRLDRDSVGRVEERPVVRPHEAITELDEESMPECLSVQGDAEVDISAFQGLNGAGTPRREDDHRKETAPAGDGHRAERDSGHSCGRDGKRSAEHRVVFEERKVVERVSERRRDERYGQTL